MKRTIVAIGGLCALVFLLHAREAGAQRRSSGQNPELLWRLQQLERRVDMLERAAGRNPEPTTIAATGLSVEDAEERVKSAAANLEYCERVFSRGYISAHERDSARFAHARSSKLLELAKAIRANDGTALRLQLELVELAAEQDLALAERQRQSIELLADKGLVSGTELQLHDRAVNFARQHLEQLRARADQAPAKPEEVPVPK